MQATPPAPSTPDKRRKVSSKGTSLVKVVRNIGEDKRAGMARSGGVGGRKGGGEEGGADKEEEEGLAQSIE